MTIFYAAITSSFYKISENTIYDNIIYYYIIITLLFLIS